MPRALAPLLLAMALAGCLAPGGAPPPQPGGPQALLPAIPDFGPVRIVGTDGNEPVVRVAPDGTVYVAALQYLYVSTDGGATFRPSKFQGALPIYATDTALAIAPDGRAYIAFDWPYAGSTGVCTSTDRGSSWSCAPTAVPGATDRMWILAPTETDVYLITNQGLTRPTFAVSHDRGATWSITHVDPMSGEQGADLAWDPVAGMVVEAATAPGRGWVVRSWNPDGSFAGAALQSVPAPQGEETLAVDAAGTWWATACAPDVPGCAPAIARSADRGAAWEVRALPTEGRTFALRFVAAGGAGRVASAWYETAAASADEADAAWRFVVAQTTGGEWRTSVLTPDPVHTGPLCAGATCLGEDRFAGDYVGLALDAEGAAHAAWSRQTGAKVPPVSAISLQPWERVEYARTAPPGRT